MQFIVLNNKKLKKKEIIHVCDSLSLQGGYEKVICDLSNIFTNNGHNVSIICLDNSSSTFYNVFDSVKVYYSSWSKSSFVSLPLAIRAIFTILNKVYNLFYLKFILNKRVSDSIIIFHRHGFNDHLDFSRFFSFCSYDLLHMDYSNEFCNKVKSFSLFFGIIKKPKMNLIVLTEKSKREAEKDGIKNVIKINNPFVTEIICHNTDAKTFLNIGRYGHQKNQRVIIEAFKLIHDKIPDWDLKIVGDGVNSSTELRELIDKYELSNKVFLFDKTNDPIFFFRSSSIFILSSRFEGLPLVLLEAIACGNLIISSKYDGHEEVLNNDNSFLFEIDDISSLSNLMVSAAYDLKLRLKLIKNAAIDLNKFSSREIYGEWVKKILNE